MTGLYPALYLLFWATALAMTLVRRTYMTVFLWPLVLLHPYAWVHGQFPSFPIGLGDIYTIACLALMSADLPRIRRSLDSGVIGSAAVLLLLTMLAHALGAVVLIVKNPTFSRLMPVMSVSSDLRFLLPILMVVAYVRTPAQVRLAIASFAIAMTAAFGLVIADGYTPAVYDLFNHTTYPSTWPDHIRRSVGGFSGPWEVGGLGAVVAVATLGLMGVRGGGRRLLGRLSGAMLFVASFLATLLSQSRSGMISWSVGLVGVGVFSSWRSRWRLLVPLAAVGIVTLTLRFGQSEWESYGVVEKIEQRFETAFTGGHMAGTAEARVDIWQHQLDWLTTGNLTTSELLVGVGGMEGSFLTFGASSHSGFLGPLMYYGIPFGMLLQIALLALLWKSIRLGVRSRNPGAAFLVVVMMAAMIGSEFLVSSTSAAAFGFLLAILARIEGMSPQAAPAVRARPAAPPVPVRPSRPVPPGPGDRPGPSQGPEAVRAEPL